MSLIALSIRREDEKVESSVDKVLEVEGRWLQSSFRCEVAAFRWSSNVFSSKSKTSGGEFKVGSSISWKLESGIAASGSFVSHLF